MANRPLQTFAGVLVLVTLAMIGLTVNPRPAFGKKALTPIRFRFTIDPKTPIKDLLPPAPLSEGKTAFLPADLAQVAEVHFQKPVLVKVGIGKLTSEEEAAWAKASEKGVSDIAHQMAKINFLNEKKADGFMEALLENRPDLAGLPFTLGGACRLKTNEHAQFREAVSLVHGSLAEKFPADFHDRLRKVRAASQLKSDASSDKSRDLPDDRTCAAALTQIIAVEFPKPDTLALPAPALRLGLVKVLAKFSQKDAEPTRALAHLAIFAVEKEVRQAALEVLRERDAQSADAVLVQGMRYPWPAIAKEACTVAAELKRKDLIPELVKMLEEPDPRAPAEREVRGKKISVVRELVRVNHLRNCLLCHPPANARDLILDGDIQGSRVDSVTSGAAPTPGQTLPRGGAGYDPFSSPDVLVRADITYLRQDFSMLLKVPNAYPWPILQRFDYLVRTRELAETEAKSLREELNKGETASPYRLAALDALRRLTGRDEGTSAAAWRSALPLP